MRITFLFILLSYSVFAQKVHPKIAIDVFEGNHLTFESPMSNTVFNIYQGNFRARLGADLRYKNATLYFDQHVYMQRDGIQFDPTQAYWYVGVKWRNKKFEIKYEHLCIHPINTYSNQYRSRYFGGWDMVSFSYGY